MSEWRYLIKRDVDKVKLFANKNEEGYFLTVVPYNKKPHERQGFIINEFERQTEIKLEDIAHKNWILLGTNGNLFISHNFCKGFK